MIKSSLALGVVAAAFSILSSVAFAAPSCSNWLPQSDGSQWRLCVGDNGKQYCESAKNGRISRVACR